MCIWTVKEEDRLCEYCLYEGGCESRPFKGVLQWDEKARRYVDTMSKVCGCDILADARRSRLVWGRNIVAYRMRKDGYTLRQVADAIRRDHATVVHAEKQVLKMLEMPRMYKEEYDIWNRFNEEIDYVEKDSEMVVLPGSESGGAER